jgi:putative membrane protein
VIPPVANYSGFTWVTAVIGIILFVLGAWLGLWMSKLEEKYK